MSRLATTCSPICEESAAKLAQRAHINGACDFCGGPIFIEQAAFVRRRNYPKTGKQRREHKAMAKPW